MSTSKKKIAFYSSDPGNHKFIIPIIEKLRLDGYECVLYNNWVIDDEASILWFDFVDNNLIVASNEYKDDLKKKKVIARLHAVEYYVGHYKGVDWSVVDDLVFVSEHMRRRVGELLVRTHTIHNGIEVDKLTYKERKPGFNIGYAGNIVPTKGILLMFHYFKQLLNKEPRYKLHLVGLNRFHGREGEYYNHYLTIAKLRDNVFETGEVDNIDEWLEGMDYLWQPSLAESFSIIVGEAMAKGIKPLINNYNGSSETWAHELIYNDFDEFYQLLQNNYNSKFYRKFIEKYSLDNEMEKINKLWKQETT